MVVHKAPNHSLGFPKDDDLKTVIFLLLRRFDRQAHLYPPPHLDAWPSKGSHDSGATLAFLSDITGRDALAV